MLRHLFLRGVAISALLFAFNAVNAWGQSVTVVEYYNKTLDAYFITGRASDQAALDTLSAFQRTGMTFAATAAASATAAQTKICRFYISDPVHKLAFLRSRDHRLRAAARAKSRGL